MNKRTNKQTEMIHPRKCKATSAPRCLHQCTLRLRAVRSARGHRSQALETQRGLFKISRATFQVDGGQ